MKKNLLILYFITLNSIFVNSQNSNYYENSQNLVGEDLKESLHNLIKNHNEFSYSSSKQILKLSDEDPANSSNIILIYKGNSINKDDFASNMEPNFWNREHVWVKSQGGFNGDETFGNKGAYSDAHNLKPCDATINSDRGTKDFDNGGVPNPEAVNCNFTSTTWEPRDEVKGDVARIIFYMDVRYNGDEGEPNLSVVDYINNSSTPFHGKLSTLLEWNEIDPVDAFERRRNQVIFNWQQNRNPFVDYPDFANLIWGNSTPNPLGFNEVNLEYSNPSELQNQSISVNISNSFITPIDQVELRYATSWFDIYNDNGIIEEYNSLMTLNSETGFYEGNIPSFSEGTDVKYTITIRLDSFNNTFYGNYKVALNPFEGDLISIQNVQGNSDYSPYENETISTKGVVTAVIGDDFYIQDGTSPRSGIYVYTSPVIPSLGDSVIVTGEVSEFQWEDPTDEKMTELAYPDAVYILNSNNPIPEPVDIETGNLNSEDYEGMLVKVNNVTVTYATFNFDDYGQWKVDDGSGQCNIHNTIEGYEYPAVVGEYLSSITGVSNYLFGEWKIDLRMPDDVDGAPDTFPPSIVNCEVINESSINLIFNEDLDETSAENIENYSINNNVIINSANQNLFQKSRVVLNVSNLLTGNYVLTISNVEDLLGNFIINETISFDFIELNDQILGCTDINALNFNELANIDDGSCEYNSNPIFEKSLFFSEYAEGSSYNKYLEIYNPTNEKISLDNYGFPSCANDPTDQISIGPHEYWNNFPQGAEIESQGVYIIAHPQADDYIYYLADHFHQYLSNGNDGYALVYGTEENYEIIDKIGDWVEDPGNGWDVAGVSDATMDHTLIRKCEISSGNSDWNSSAGTNAENSEWIVNNNEDWSNLGIHNICYDQIIFGCTNENSINYNPNATLDDGSCIDPIFGCMDSTYQEYDPMANVNSPDDCLNLIGIHKINFNESFKLFPNPSNQLINLVANNNFKKINISITNNIGMLVSKIEFGNLKQNDKIQIDVSELKSGFYHIILNSRELNVSTYFVKN